MSTTQWQPLAPIKPVPQVELPPAQWGDVEDNTVVVYPKTPRGTCRVVIIRRSITKSVPGTKGGVQYKVCCNAGKWYYTRVSLFTGSELKMGRTMFLNELRKHGASSEQIMELVNEV